MRSIRLKARYVDDDVVLRVERGSIRGYSLSGEPVFTATVVLDHEPTAGHVFVKTWSENVGLYEALVVAGVIAPARDWIRVGPFDAWAAEAMLLWPEDAA